VVSFQKFWFKKLFSISIFSKLKKWKFQTAKVSPKNRRQNQYFTNFQKKFPSFVFVIQKDTEESLETYRTLTCRSKSLKRFYLIPKLIKHFCFHSSRAEYSILSNFQLRQLIQFGSITFFSFQKKRFFLFMLLLRHDVDVFLWSRIVKIMLYTYRRTFYLQICSFTSAKMVQIVNPEADPIKLFFFVFQFSLISLSVLLHIEKNHW